MGVVEDGRRSAGRPSGKKNAYNKNGVNETERERDKERERDSERERNRRRLLRKKKGEKKERLVQMWRLDTILMKVSKVEAKTVSRGRLFQSLTVLGKKLVLPCSVLQEYCL